MNVSSKQLHIDHTGHHMCSRNQCDLLVGVSEVVLFHMACPLLIFLPETREVVPGFSKALGVHWLLFQHHRH